MQQQQYQCSNCGAPVAFGMRFCGNCGLQLNWPTQKQLQPPPVKKRGLGQWVKNNKFWSSVIILFVLVEILSLFNIISPAGAGETLGVYIFFGGLIWSIQAKRRGLTMITLGSILAPVAILLWVMLLAGAFSDTDGFAIGMAVSFTFLSVLFILWGIARYRRTGTD